MPGHPPKFERLDLDDDQQEFHVIVITAVEYNAVLGDNAFNELKTKVEEENKQLLSQDLILANDGNDTRSIQNTMRYTELAANRFNHL